MKRQIDNERIVIQKSLFFVKPKQLKPSLPIRKISNNYVIDSNGTVFNSFQVNGETVYETIFNSLI